MADPDNDDVIDNLEPEADESMRCPDCGAYPEEDHLIDCSYDDEDDDIDEEEVDDFS